MTIPLPPWSVGPDEPGVYDLRADHVRPLDVLAEGQRVRKVDHYLDGRIRLHVGHDEVSEERWDSARIGSLDGSPSYDVGPIALKRIAWNDPEALDFRGDETVRVARGVPPGAGTAQRRSSGLPGASEAKLVPGPSPEDQILGQSDQAEP